MLKRVKRVLPMGLALLAAMSLAGCSEEDKPQVSLDPVAIHAAD